MVHDYDSKNTTDSYFGYGRSEVSSNGHHKEKVEEAVEDGITLARYAEAKRLPVEFLASLNLKDINYNFHNAVRIPYPDELGRERYYRHRLSLKAEPRFHSPPKHIAPDPVPYGLQVLPVAREVGYILLVEGESDAQVCWYNDIPALGIPGVQAWKKYGKEWARYLENIPLVLVPVESDDGGEKFWSLLSTTPGLYGRVHKLPVTTPHAKDIGKVWEQAGEEAFKPAIEAMIELVKRGVENVSRNSEGVPPYLRETLLPTVSLKEITEEAEETSEYYAYPLFRAGELSLLVGEAKFSGKTTLTFSALKAVLEGDLFLGEETKRAKVLYLSEQGNNLSRAVETSKMDLEDEDSFRVVRFRDVWQVPWAPIIERGVFTCEHEDREILVVDTFNAFAHIKGSEENDAGAVSERLEALKVAAQAHDLAVMLIHHSGRESAIRGSSVFDGTVDTIVVLSRPPGNPEETGDNVRRIVANGRCEPLNINIELTDEGIYTPLGSTARLKFINAVRAVRETAPTNKGAAIDLGTFVSRAKGEGVDVAKTTVEEAIRWLHKKGTLVREGEGKSGHPFRYWKREGSATVKSEPKTKDLQKDTLQMSPANRGGHPIDSGRHFQPPLTTPPGYVFVDTNEARDELAKAISDTPNPVALDTETSGLEIPGVRVRLLQVKLAEPSLEEYGVPQLVDLSAVDPQPLLLALRNKDVVLHNASYDLAVLREAYGYEHSGGVLDTLLASQVYYTGTTHKHGYEHALKRFLDVEVGKHGSDWDWFSEITPEMLGYAADDVRYLHDLTDAILSKIMDKADHLLPVVDLENKMAKVTAELKVVGMPVSETAWSECVAESRVLADERLNELDALVNEGVPEKFVAANTKNKSVPEGRATKVNWNSPPQALWAFGAAGVKGIKATGAEALAGVDHPLAQAIVAYRHVLDIYKRFRSTTITGGRVYGDWMQLAARTGRMSCKTPPLQGIPEGLRRAFVAPEGHKLVISDLSQIEIRVLAVLSEDEKLREDLEAGVDVHRRVAASVFSKDYGAVTDKERKLCKSLVFGTLYGSGLGLFTATVNRYTGKNYSSDAVEKRFRSPLFAPYPGVQEWMDKVAHDYDSRRKDRKMVSYTRFGRRRLQVDEVPKALNTPIQAGALDVMKAIAVEAYATKKPHWKLIGLIHDELLVEVPEEDADTAAEWLQQVMTGVGHKMTNHGVPEGKQVKVDAATKVCNSWDEKE
jgi:DNA polymerase I-like protein with 3'-5' exonuclease and polymerase domains